MKPVKEHNSQEFNALMDSLPTLKELADKMGYEIRHHSVKLNMNEDFDKAIKPFDFSNDNGGTIDSFKYYNDYYLYPKQ